MELNGFKIEEINHFLSIVFNEDIHQKRLASLANATLGCMEAASLAVQAIGHSLAVAQELNPKHAIKQVDRLVSNKGIEVEKYFSYWVPYMIGSRKEIITSLDWTDFGKDNQSTLSLQLQTSHGRSLPLMWKTVEMSDGRKNKREYEKNLLQHFKSILPTEVEATIVADRGFCDTDFFADLEELKLNYVIRIFENIYVEDKDGTCKKARDFVPKNGSTKVIKDGKITRKKYPMKTIACVQAKKMKNCWCIVSCRDMNSETIKKYYGKRWGVESTFRDIKDLRFGMGLDTLRIKRCDRRDRLLLINALALVLLTLLGAAGESIGMDKMLKSNTSKKRTHSLFRQGCMLFGWLNRSMRDEWFTPLMQKFNDLLTQQISYRQLFFVV